MSKKIAVKPATAVWSACAQHLLNKGARQSAIVLQTIKLLRKTLLGLRDAAFLVTALLLYQQLASLLADITAADTVLHA